MSGANINITERLAQALETFFPPDFPSRRWTFLPGRDELIMIAAPQEAREATAALAAYRGQRAVGILGGAPASTPWEPHAGGERQYDPAPECKGAIAARERLEPEEGAAAAGSPGAQNGVTSRVESNPDLRVLERRALLAAMKWFKAELEAPSAPETVSHLRERQALFAALADISVAFRPGGQP